MVASGNDIGKIAAGINDTSGEFAPVSATPAANFATSLASVVDTGGKLSTTLAAEIFASKGAPPVSRTPAAKLPPVSTTPAANFATSLASVVDTGSKFATGVNDTGGKFSAGINDTGGNLPPVSTTPVANNGNNIRLLRP